MRGNLRLVLIDMVLYATVLIMAGAAAILLGLDGYWAGAWMGWFAGVGIATIFLYNWEDTRVKRREVYRASEKL